MMQEMAATNTILQTIVDDDKRGRVMAYYAMAFQGVAPFGSLIAGWTHGPHRRARHPGRRRRRLHRGRHLVRLPTSGNPQGRAAHLCTIGDPPGADTPVSRGRSPGLYNVPYKDFRNATTILRFHTRPAETMRIMPAPDAPPGAPIGEPPGLARAGARGKSDPRPARPLFPATARHGSPSPASCTIECR